jgi:hypothetical protein
MRPISSCKLECEDKSHPLGPISPIHGLLLKIISTRLVSIAAVHFLQTDIDVGRACQQLRLSQVVSIPSSARIVITAGQVGFDLKTGKLDETSVEDQKLAARASSPRAIYGSTKGSLETGYVSMRSSSGDRS